VTTLTTGARDDKLHYPVEHDLTRSLYQCAYYEHGQIVPELCWTSNWCLHVLCSKQLKEAHTDIQWLYWRKFLHSFHDILDV